MCHRILFTLNGKCHIQLILIIIPGIRDIFGRQCLPRASSVKNSLRTAKKIPHAVGPAAHEVYGANVPKARIEI